MGIASRVEAVVDAVCGQDRDLVREQGIEGAEQAIGRVSLKLEARDLPPCVNPRIGAPRNGEADGLGQDPRQSRL